ncbi:DUF924 domain-containing protein [Tateyamaria omphalii]|uniref:DUF924 family protein n=1 Tax=Tateyamaria omphalii TaxID=299262 RepID=UPI001C99BF64|nr:DUF924 family protein [Tateyamaria omphalii]MBY5932938.1 DUF924 domain-containing protein [Tateyamaria omphalii]
MVGPDEILRFWLDECGPEDWFKSDPDFDQVIRDRFGATWKAATEGKFALWLTYPSGALAYIILTDQFPRNMFRDDAAAFSTDKAALAAAKSAIAKGWDMRIDAPARQFFYMPLEHSENACDQDRAVRLICERMDDAEFLLHARAHREVIRQFGRFPHRNGVLGRATTAAEQAHLDAGGYGEVVRGLQAAEAA